MSNNPQRSEFGPEFDSERGPVEPVFAIAPVRGVRAFNLTSQGWLAGITYPYCWSPGVNTALCMTTFSGMAVPNTQEPHRLSQCKHGLGHGFYAYFEGSNTYRSATIGRPEAVIEGYGTGDNTPVIGSRGFRAGLAEIVALTFPAVVLKQREAYEMALARYTGIPLFDTFEAMIQEFPLDNGQTYR